MSWTKPRASFLVVVVELDQQIAHEFPGFVVGQAAVLGNDDLDVQVLTVFALELGQALFDLGQTKPAVFRVAGLAIANQDTA